MIISIALGLCACGSTKEKDASQTTAPALSEETAPASPSENSEDNKEATISGADEPTNVTIETITPSQSQTNKKEVYWATVDKDPADVWYHKIDCEKIKDKKPEVLTWEIIDAIEMTPCEICKP